MPKFIIMTFCQKRVIAAIVLSGFVAVFSIAGTKTAFSANAPYPPSPVIQDISWDWSTYTDAAPGSDQRPVTWADDDNLYATWGDGGGFNGTNSRGRVSMGVARIEGIPPNWKGVNVWGGYNPESSQSAVSGKVQGLLCVDSVLYLWSVRQESWDAARIIKSTDHGLTWQIGPFDFKPPLHTLRPIQFGKCYQGARDNFV